MMLINMQHSGSSGKELGVGSREWNWAVGSWSWPGPATCRLPGLQQATSPQGSAASFTKQV